MMYWILFHLMKSSNPFDAPMQQELNMVIYFPFQYFDDVLSYDLESE
jgi:hypothetical protein